MDYKRGTTFTYGERDYGIRKKHGHREMICPSLPSRAFLAVFWSRPLTLDIALVHLCPLLRSPLLCFGRWQDLLSAFFSGQSSLWFLLQVHSGVCSSPLSVLFSLAVMNGFSKVEPSSWDRRWIYLSHAPRGEKQKGKRAEVTFWSQGVGLLLPFDHLLTSEFPHATPFAFGLSSGCRHLSFGPHTRPVSVSCLLFMAPFVVAYCLLSLCPASLDGKHEAENVEEVKYTQRERERKRERKETKANDVHNEEANERPTSSSGSSAYSRQSWRKCCRPWACPKRSWRRQTTKANKKRVEGQPVGKTMRRVDLHRRTERIKLR